MLQKSKSFASIVFIIILLILGLYFWNNKKVEPDTEKQSETQLLQELDTESETIDQQIKEGLKTTDFDPEKEDIKNIIEKVDKLGEIFAEEEEE